MLFTELRLLYSKFINLSIENNFFIVHTLLKMFYLFDFPFNNTYISWRCCFLWSHKYVIILSFFCFKHISLSSIIELGSVLICTVTVIQYQHKYNLHRELEAGETITFSPYYTVWADNNYYVICRNEDTGEMCHYRIDRLHNIAALEREASPADYGFSASEYTHKMIYLKGESEKLYEVTCSADKSSRPCQWSVISPVRTFSIRAFIVKSRRLDAFSVLIYGYAVASKSVCFSHILRSVLGKAKSIS